MSQVLEKHRSFDGMLLLALSAVLSLFACGDRTMTAGSPAKPAASLSGDPGTTAAGASSGTGSGAGGNVSGNSSNGGGTSGNTTGENGNDTGSGSPVTSSSTDITGTVVDGSTGKPIVGSILVELEAPSPGDYSAVQQTIPSPDGKFTFKNMPGDKAYAIAIAAVSGASNYYIPKLIVGSGDGSPNTPPWFATGPIEPGTDIGTVTLDMPSGPTSFTIEQPVSSETANGAGTPIEVFFQQRAYLNGWKFTIPFAANTTPVITEAGSNCPSGTNCAVAQLTLSAFPVQYAGFNPSGMTFQTSSGYGLDIQGIASEPGNSTSDCSPDQMEVYNYPLTPDITQVGQNMSFQSCH